MTGRFGLEKYRTGSGSTPFGEKDAGRSPIDYEATINEELPLAPFGEKQKGIRNLLQNGIHFEDAQTLDELSQRFRTDRTLRKMNENVSFVQLGIPTKETPEYLGGLRNLRKSFKGQERGIWTREIL
ncbi:hypothetical protein Q644_12000 [Brucella intermedia 229E]|uniref:Uncharacterized protein n=1 Tax=Brucella intermedia 229E TaxID=1337887 RepID=U4VKE7_9HYPH|nr:hypothetical protein Q644_12000 [Brucella intermedia 229E]